MLDHTNLRVWQRSHQLAIEIHQLLERPSTHSAPGLASQLKRAAASIPANIAEGAAQVSTAQFARFLTIAIGSAGETENHVAFAHGLGIMSEEVEAAMRQEVREIRRMLVGLRR